MNDIIHKIEYTSIKRGVKGITNALLLDLINHCGEIRRTRHAEWKAVQIEPPWIMYHIYRRRLNHDNDFKFYGLYLDETGINEVIIVKCDEVKL